MTGRGSGWTEEQERDYQVGELYTRARRALRRGQIAQAEQLAQEAAALAPDTTTVQELLGDVAFARKSYADAKAHFERALQIEPVNADAERKLGQVVLVLGQATELRQRVEEVVADPGKRHRFARQPLLAGLLSFLFPGFGQLYNSEYEKGLGVFAGAAVLLMLLLDRLVLSPFATMARAARPEHGHPRRVPVGDQMEGTREALAHYGTLAWLLIALGIAIFLGLWIYSIVDAYRTCQAQAREQDDLGVEV